MKLSALFVSLALLSTAAFAQMVDMVDMGNVDLNSVQIVDDNVAWAAGYDNDASASVFYVTTDAGDNWTKTTGNIGDEFWVHIAPVDADNAVAFATTSIHYTTDGGATWTEAVNDGGAFFNGGEMIDADNGFVVGDSKDAANWDIRQTTDGGATWTAVTAALGEESWGIVHGEYWLDANNGWFSTWGTEVVKTTDGGLTWTTHNNAIPSSHTRVRSFGFKDATNGVAGTQQGGIGVTNDGGETFTIVDESMKSTAAPDYKRVYVDYAMDDMYVAACNERLSISHDGGMHWSVLKTFSTDYVFENVDMYETTGGEVLGFAVATGGAIARITSAAPIYASPTGTAGGDGSKGNPYDLQTADDNMSGGSILYLLPGAYNLTSADTKYFEPIADNITVIGLEGPENTIIDGNETADEFGQMFGAWHVEGITFQNFAYSDQWNGDNALFKCYTSTNDSSFASRVTNCRFLNNGAMGFWGANGNNLHLQIDHCLIANNTPESFVTAVFRGVRLYNNTFYNNVAETHFNDRSVISFWNYGNDDGQADLIAYNNIIAYDTTSTSSNEGGIFAAKNDDPDGSGANYYVTNVYSGHNLFIGNVVNNTEPGDSLTAVLGDGDENNHHFDGGKLVGMDPMFNAVDMGYYYLKSGSPAIEAGMDVGLPYDDAAPHIGAFGPVPTVYTSPTASGSGESMDDPGELDALLADATPYQTVYFLPGTYEPTAKVEPDQDQHRGLKLIGMNGALETTIDGQSNTLLELIDLYEGMELAGFTIKDIGDGTWTKDLFNFPGTVTPDEPIKVHSNIFTGNNTRVFQGENGCEANVWAYNNVVYENENVFLHGSFRGFHLINNTFYDNDSHEADWDPAWMEPYPFSQDSMSLVVKNNIFAKDSSSNAYLMVIRTESGDSPDIELITRANMFHDVGYNDAATKAPIEFWEKNSTPTELNVDTAGSFLYGDPMYEAPELGEFTLLPTSPAIGAAEAVPEIGVAAGMNLGCLVTDLLPAELAALSASVSDGKVTLTWKTHTETDVKGFDVERKADGGSFAKIGHVGAAGTSSKERSYSFVDNAGSGKYAYRLKVVDLDGAFRYTKSVEVNLDVVTEYALEQNYPNPFNPTTTINFQIPQDANVSLTVYDVLGAKVATLVDGQMQAGAHRVDFNASNLATGAYFYRLEAGDFVSVKKMLLLK